MKLYETDSLKESHVEKYIILCEQELLKKGYRKDKLNDLKRAIPVILAAPIRQYMSKVNHSLAE